VPHTDVEAEILAFLRSEQDSYRATALVDHWHHGPKCAALFRRSRSRIHTGWDELLPRFKEGFRQFPQNFDARSAALGQYSDCRFGDLAWVSYDQIVLKQAEGLHAAPSRMRSRSFNVLTASGKLFA
jgi:hypothetical protein